MSQVTYILIKIFRGNNCDPDGGWEHFHLSTSVEYFYITGAGYFRDNVSCSFVTIDNGGMMTHPHPLLSQTLADIGPGQSGNYFIS